MPIRSFFRFASPFAALLLAATHVTAAVTYTYDAHHRLLSAIYNDGTAIQYTYDIAGNRLTSTSLTATSKMYEDAEDGSILGWDIYDSDPAGATITNVYDAERASRVIECKGNLTNNGYRLRNNDGSSWNNSTSKVLEWSMRYSENFVVYIAAQTKNGFRYIYYTPANTDYLGNDTYVHHGLGSHLIDGNWHTVVRDIAYDLKQAQPGNELQAVLGFLIRGTGRVDDIKSRGRFRIRKKSYV